MRLQVGCQLGLHIILPWGGLSAGMAPSTGSQAAFRIEAFEPAGQAIAEKPDPFLDPGIEILEVAREVPTGAPQKPAVR